MTYTQTVIEMIKDELKKDSDYAVAKALHIGGQYMTRYRNGSQFSNDTAMAAAKILGLPPMLIIARINKETCKSEHLSTWEAVEEIALAEMDIKTLSPAKAVKNLKEAFNHFILCSISKIEYKDTDNHQNTVMVA